MVEQTGASLPPTLPPGEAARQEAERQARIKDASRSSRLSFRKYGEHQLRREFKDMAIEKCNPEVKAFAQCAQEKGLMVVVSCQSFHRAVGNCMRKHNSDEEFEKYKAANQDVLDKYST